MVLTQFALKDQLREGIDQFILDSPLEGPRSVDRVKALAGEVAHGFIGDFQFDSLVCEALSEVFELNSDDAFYLVDTEGSEDDEFIQAVHEFWPEVHLHFFENPLLCLLKIGIADRIAIVVRAQVTGHDNNRIFKVDRSSLSVG